MTLLEQIANDRYDESQCSQGGDPIIERARRQGWNAGSRHVEGLVRMHLGISEIVEAPAMDLRLRAEMTGGVK
jgi:hypothetical protein